MNGEMIKPIAEYGVLLVIAAVFIWDSVKNARSISGVLRELQSATAAQVKALDSLRLTADNTATALNIIQTTLNNNGEVFERHDRRSEHIGLELQQILEHVRKDGKQ